MTDQMKLPEGAPFVKVTRTIHRPVAETFDYVLDVDLTHIFPRHGEAPGIVSTTVSKGWGHPGQERVNTSDEGHTTREILEAVDPGKSFSYRTEGFTSPVLKDLIDHIEGSWIFIDNGNGTTSIEWIYRLIPVSPAAKQEIEEKLMKRLVNDVKSEHLLT